MSAQELYEVKVSFNGAEYRAYIRGIGVSATCTWSVEEAVNRAAWKALKHDRFTAAKKSGNHGNEIWIVKILVGE